MVREQGANLRIVAGAIMKVLLAVEPRAYREAIGLAIENLRPDVEVTVCAPEDLVSEVARLGPELVICSLPYYEASEEVVAWVELRSPQGYWQKATIHIRGHHSELVNVQLDDLLSVVDSTEKAIHGSPQEESLPRNRYGRGASGH